MGNCNFTYKANGQKVLRKNATASGGLAKGSLTLANGERIEFDGELKFGRDSGVSGTAREQIEKWENKRRSNKIEFAYAVTQDGEIIGETKGGKKGVMVKKNMTETKGAILTHIHPRNAGMFGGTFSTEDLSLFANRDFKTMRATAKEGTYSISKQSNFNSYGFTRMFELRSHDRREEYNKRGRQITSDYKSGKITYEEAIKRSNKEFNTYITGVHQDLVDGQNKYGYTYGLEKT